MYPYVGKYAHTPKHAKFPLGTYIHTLLCFIFRQLTSTLIGCAHMFVCTCMHCACDNLLSGKA